jgi:competence protein ComEA
MKCFTPEKKALFLIATILYGITLLRFSPFSLSQKTPDPHLNSGRSVSVVVVGEVNRPGKYLLDVSSTVAEAIDAAGGAIRSADLSRLNLPAPLIHNSVLRVPSKHYGFEPVISINRSTVRELILIPGIGPKLAERIVRDRVEKGLFDDEADLLRVPGIGSKKLALIMEHAVLNKRE